MPVSQLRRLVRRAARTSPAEWRTRLSQAWARRSDCWLARLGLEPTVPAWERSASGAGRFFFNPAEAADRAELVRRRLPAEAAATVAQAERAASRRFDLLGFESLDFGDPIDWSWEPVARRSIPLHCWSRIPYLDYKAVGDHKIVWELGRHQHLTALARAALYADEPRFAAEAVSQWRGWRAANPYPYGIHWTSALEVAFRALAWLWLRALIPPTSTDLERFHLELEEELGRSARYLERFLSTYFSPNTHLLGEAVALYAIGAVCRSFQAASRWRAVGRRVTLEQARRQIRSDGSHFEQSTYYHVYALDFFLHFRTLAERNGEPAATLDLTIERMAEFLWRISQGGAAASFGDDDGGRVFNPRRNRREHLLDPLTACAILFGRSDFAQRAGGLREEAVWLLGEPGVHAFDALRGNERPPQSCRQDPSGWHVMAGSEAAAEAIVIDAGPLGALSGGHGHADALSLQWIRDDRALLDDPGTGRYPAELPERDAFRLTAAHSTLTVDGLPQAEPLGAFGWTELPAATTEFWAAGRGIDVFVGRHDGYGRLDPPLVHRRLVARWKTGEIFVVDRIEGPGRRQIVQTWRAGPAIDEIELAPEGALFRGDQATFTAAWSPADAIRAEAFQDPYSPCYGRMEQAPSLRLTRTAEAPAVVAAAFTAGDELGDFRLSPPKASAHEPNCLAFELETRRRKIILVVGCGRPWQWDRWESDALLLTRENGESGRMLRAAGASYLRISGQDAFDRPDPLLEWSIDDGETLRPLDPIAP